ncbi:MAG: hypothetical protein PHW56_00785 [Methanosarcinaceae archaeon]|nr:hypothetical protein [Methanosarcinaceae archaeon]
MNHPALSPSFRAVRLHLPRLGFMDLAVFAGIAGAACVSFGKAGLANLVWLPGNLILVFANINAARSLKEKELFIEAHAAQRQAVLFSVYLVLAFLGTLRGVLA